jgi:RecJ-like exonuclease
MNEKTCQTCGENVDRPTGNFCKACRNKKQNQSRTLRNKTTREIEQERSGAAAFNNKLLKRKW